MVLPQPLSVHVLLSKGNCCGSICQNCPYVDVLGRRHIKGTRRVDPNILQSLGLENTEQQKREETEKE